MKSNTYILEPLAIRSEGRISLKKKIADNFLGDISLVLEHIVSESKMIKRYIIGIHIKNDKTHNANTVLIIMFRQCDKIHKVVVQNITDNYAYVFFIYTFFTIHISNKYGE